MSTRARSLIWHLSIFGILIVVPLVLVTGLVSYFYVVQVQHAMDARDEQIVRDAVRAADREVENAILLLTAFSTSPSLAGADFQRFYNETKQVIWGNDGLQVALRLSDGQLIFTTLHPFGAVTGALDDTLRAARHRALDTGGIAVSNLSYGAANKEPFVAVLKPVTLGGSVYLLEVSVSASRFSQILRSTLGTTDWLVGITGTDDRIIARNWNEEQYIGQRAGEEYLRNTRGSKGRFYATSVEGVRVYDVYARSTLTKWTIGAGIPLEVYHAPVYHAAAAVGATLAAGLLASLGLALLYSRRFTKPLQELLRLSFSTSTSRLEPISTDIKEFGQVSDEIIHHLQSVHDHEQQRDVLVNELNHRVRNTLAVIQSVALQTLKSAPSAQEAAEVFQARLIALSAAHDILTREGWEGADIRDIVTQAVAPYREQGKERFQIEGSSLPLPPKATLALSLALHELCTNAVKYGALSTREGRVCIRWHAATDRFRLTWEEIGGPPVSQPKRQGFGSVLITRVLADDLDGLVKLDYRPSGLICTVEAPLSGSNAEGDLRQ